MLNYFSYWQTTWLYSWSHFWIIGFETFEIIYNHLLYLTRCHLGNSDDFREIPKDHVATNTLFFWNKHSHQVFTFMPVIFYPWEGNTQTHGFPKKDNRHFTQDCLGKLKYISFITSSLKELLKSLCYSELFSNINSWITD